MPPKKRKADSKSPGTQSKSARTTLPMAKQEVINKIKASTVPRRAPPRRKRGMNLKSFDIEPLFLIVIRYLITLHIDASSPVDEDPPEALDDAEIRTEAVLPPSARPKQRSKSTTLTATTISTRSTRRSETINGSLAAALAATDSPEDEDIGEVSERDWGRHPAQSEDDKEDEDMSDHIEPAEVTPKKSKARGREVVSRVDDPQPSKNAQVCYFRLEISQLTFPCYSVFPYGSPDSSSFCCYQCQYEYWLGFLCDLDW